MRRPRLAIVLSSALALSILALTPLAAAAGHQAGTANQKAGACKTAKSTLRHHLDQSASQPAVQFGIQGGNIRPWSVNIGADGTVTASGINARNQHLTNPQQALNGFLAAADMEGFFTMSGTQRCSGTLPDIASSFVAVHTTRGDKRVQVHGGCNSSFNQLFALLTNMADLSRS
jgi:hypothetical protein